MVPPFHPSQSGGLAAANFRQYVKELAEEGDLLSISKEVDPRLELAAIVRKVYETEHKAPLFENIKGRQNNGLFRVLGAPVGASSLPGKRFIRIAKSLGLPSESSGRDIIYAINRAKKRQPISPREFETGPVKQHRIFGDEIDLERLPVPLFHEDDGGKYLQTFGMYIVQSPDGSWVNWSITRGMVNGKRSLAGPTMSAQDIGVIRKMWQDRGEDMPFSLCFGVPPAAIMVGGMPIPKGVNESGFVGALLGQPVDVVKSETNNIWVPRDAEIVLEGVVSRTETADEGPFVEYHGHVFPGSGKPCPVFNIDAITYRDDPILPICVAGRATEESETVWALTQAAEVLNICEAAELPIEMVWSPFESHCLWFVLQVNWSKLRALRTNMKDFCEKVGRTVFSTKPGFYIPKIYLVGEDIDPTNLNELIWAEATRCQPGTNEFFFDAYGNIPLIPYVSHGIKDRKNHVKVVRCCMFPAEFMDSNLSWKHGSFRGSYSQDIQDKVNDSWSGYGF
ncbi:UbiD-like decarboxylase [Colletotrichum gloeosporioides]|uniref:Ferulic acid decarboxylase 1 n=1 Tax=Colletotrichum gloeosporioides TaxID=474922 RepID=A0A8H4CLA1_COLGL|nr:UbiD-like decarboxylase [Colletotrichum gloeosporioides]KAF3805990.1 UbiD-like decarboxylase [Colletotrichum gloeosporioides]